MEDCQIVELYWQKSVDAISETSGKYGAYCFTVWRTNFFNVLQQYSLSNHVAYRSRR